jgi:hypothetical protein
MDGRFQESGPMKVITTLFCEKALKLHNGRSQLVGVIPGRAEMTSAPIGEILPLDAVIWLDRTEKGDVKSELRIESLAGDILAVKQVSLSFSGHSWSELVITNIPLERVRHGGVVVKLKEAGGQWVEAGRLEVTITAPLIDVEPLARRLSA